MSVPFGPGCPWWGMYQRFGPPNVDWCEETVCSWVNEPANAWSNLAYILPGLWLWRRCSSEGLREAAALSLAAVVMGACSFVYHASNNALSQYLDFFGMYLFMNYFLMLGLRRLLGLPAGETSGIYRASVVVLTLATPLARWAGFPIQLLIVAGAVAILVVEARCRASGKPVGDIRLFWAMVGAFVLASACSVADVTRLACDPADHILQGHALWHVLSALGMVLGVLYQRQIRYA